MQRDRAKKAKAAAKRERRTDKAADDVAPADPDEIGVSAGSTGGDGGGELSATELLAEIERLHRRYEAEQIDYEEYDEAKRDLLARLPID